MLITSNTQLAHCNLKGWVITRKGRAGDTNKGGFDQHPKDRYTGGSRNRLTVCMECWGLSKK